MHRAKLKWTLLEPEMGKLPPEKVRIKPKIPLEKPRQEISRILKYLIFFVNFIFVICGLVCAALGVYLYANEFRPVMELVDFYLNPAVMLMTVGVLISLIAFLGCMGALREQVYLLKIFALALFCCYILLVVAAFILFILFYSDAAAGISIHNLLLNSVTRYHDNDNYRDFMDYVQVQLKCCGVTSQGYKDWTKSPLYNCSSGNLQPERCGVPYTCCKAAGNSADDLESTTSQLASGQLLIVAGNPKSDLAPQATPAECWKKAQQQSLTEVDSRINTNGCLQPLQKAFEAHAVMIGAVVGAIIIPVCLAVTFSNILAKQIERQHYLLAKEARKEERRRKRAKQRFRDPFAQEFTPPRRHSNHHYSTVNEMAEPGEGPSHESPISEPTRPLENISPVESASKLQSEEQKPSTSAKIYDKPRKQSPASTSAKIYDEPRRKSPAKRKPRLPRDVSQSKAVDAELAGKRPPRKHSRDADGKRRNAPHESPSKQRRRRRKQSRDNLDGRKHSRDNIEGRKQSRENLEQSRDNLDAATASENDAAPFYMRKSKTEPVLHGGHLSKSHDSLSGKWDHNAVEIIDKDDDLRASQRLA